MSNSQHVSVMLGMNGIHKVEVEDMPVGKAIDTAIKRAGLNDYRIVEFNEVTGEWQFTDTGQNLIIGVNDSGTHSPDPNAPASEFRSLSIEAKRKNG